MVLVYNVSKAKKHAKKSQPHKGAKQNAARWEFRLVNMSVVDVTSANVMQRKMKDVVGMQTFENMIHHDIITTNDATAKYSSNDHFAPSSIKANTKPIPTSVYRTVHAMAKT